MFKLILASKSKVRKEILDKNNILAQVQPSSVDEDPIKQSLLNEMHLQKLFLKIWQNLKLVELVKKILMCWF